MNQLTEEIFLDDVREHKANIVKDDGIYRHIEYRRHGKGYNLWFDLITWPGCLTINGDMGTWSFSRVPDMFSFFRKDHGEGSGIFINPSYWSEKLIMGSGGYPRVDGKIFDADEFREGVLRHIDNALCEEHEADRRLEVRRATLEDVFCYDNEHQIRQAICDFSYDGFQFDLMEMPDGRVWSYHFLWCLYAIVWGIAEYDKVKNANSI